MDLRLTTLILVAILAFTSCSKDQDLTSETTIIHHPSCDVNDAAVLAIAVDGGESPYIIQVRSLADNKLIYTENTTDKNLELSIPGLNMIDYAVTIKSSDFQETTEEFSIFPEGKSSIGHRVMIEGIDGMRALKNRPISLYLSQKDGVSLLHTTMTDEEGYFLFSDLSSGFYMLEMTLPEKYSDLKLEAYTQDGASIIQRGSSQTELVPLACEEMLELDLYFAY